MPRGKAPVKGKKAPTTRYLVAGLIVSGLVLGGVALILLLRTPELGVTAVPGHNNLQTLAIFYGRYVGAHRGKPPAKLDEFKSWLKKQPREQFESLQVDPDKLDALFTSPRDNQPFGFVFSASAMTPGPEGKGSVIIYEQTGVGGKRLVAYSTSQIEEVDEATFQRLVPGK